MGRFSDIVWCDLSVTFRMGGLHSWDILKKSPFYAPKRARFGTSVIFRDVCYITLLRSPNGFSEAMYIGVCWGLKLQNGSCARDAHAETNTPLVRRKIVLSPRLHHCKSGNDFITPSYFDPASKFPGSGRAATFSFWRKFIRILTSHIDWISPIIWSVAATLGA